MNSNKTCTDAKIAQDKSKGTRAKGQEQRLQRQMRKRRVDIVQLSHERIDIYDVTTQYIKWYNREVNQIFNDIERVSPRLHSSNVHAGSMYRGGADEEDDEVVEIGTHWSSVEKRKFFRYLSRYSIHRLDEWYVLFNGSKSKQEVLLYYEVLKKNLVLLKEKNADGLVRFEEYPIAYEVDDNFIEFEEHMSQRLVERDNLAYFCEDGPTTDAHDELINVDRWNSRWRVLYGKSKVASEVDTTRPDRINDEAEYRDQYELNQDVVEFKGRRYVISQYEPVEAVPISNTDRSKVKIPKMALRMSQPAMEYIGQCVRDHIRELLYKCVLPNINDRSIHGSKVKRLYKITKGTNLKKLVSRRYKSVKLGVEGGHNNDMIIRHRADKMPYPHIVTADEIYNGIALMRREGLYVKNRSVGVVDTLNKFEIEYGDAARVFQSRNFLEPLKAEIVYDKLNHCIPVVNNDKAYEGVVTMERVMQSPLDQELKIICGLFPLQNSIKIANSGFRIVNDNSKYYGLKEIDAILNLRLDNEIELALIDEETARLDRMDLAQSRAYLDTVYHYFGTLLNFNVPGAKISRGQGNTILNGCHTVVAENAGSVERIERTESSKNTQSSNSNGRDRMLWPSVVTAFDRVNC